MPHRHSDDYSPRSPDDRRQHERREEDVERAATAEHQSAVEVWAGWMIFKRAPLTVTIATAGSLLTFFFTNLGFRVTGTPAEVQALRAKVERNDSLTNVRISRLEQTIADRGDDFRELQSSVKFLSYVVCVQIRRQDPSAAPPGCEPIIRSKGDGAP